MNTRILETTKDGLSSNVCTNLCAPIVRRLRCSGCKLDNFSREYRERNVSEEIKETGEQGSIVSRCGERGKRLEWSSRAAKLAKEILYARDRVPRKDDRFARIMERPSCFIRRTNRGIRVDALSFVETLLSIRLRTGVVWLHRVAFLSVKHARVCSVVRGSTTRRTH